MSKKKHANLIRKLLLTCLVTIIQPTLALDIIPSSSHDYYKLGGGSDISMPPVTDQKDIRIGGDINTNLGFSCDGFNPSLSIANTINNIKSSIQGLGGDVVNSATAAVASMPMYLLSKSNKDLYNLLQNTMTGAEDTFHLSMKSCQDAMNAVNSGKSPYRDWFSVSDSQGWLNDVKRLKQGQDVDINDTKKEVTKDPSKFGVPWVHKGQNSGGTNGNQVPIKVIYDVVVAGYNATVDPTLPLDAKATQATPDSGLGRYWRTADDAGKWAKLVLGDITISSRAGDDSTTRGSGLMTLVQSCPDGASNSLTCARTVDENLAAIVNGIQYPSAEELKSVSSNEMMAAPAIIQSIRNKTPEIQTIAISKWSQDVAIQNVVDQALTMRRLLIAGAQTKPVHNLKPALNAVNHAVSILNEDIKNILFQFQVRKELQSNTAEVILGDQAQSEALAVSQNGKTQQESLVHGSIYKKD